MKKENRTRDGQKLQDDHVDLSLRYKMKTGKKMFYLLMFLILSWLIVGLSLIHI